MKDKRQLTIEWAKVAKAILANPRDKHFCPFSREVVQFEIKNYPMYNKIHVLMKSKEMSDFIEVRFDIEE